MGAYNAYSCAFQGRYALPAPGRTKSWKGMPAVGGDGNSMGRLLVYTVVAAAVLLLMIGCGGESEPPSATPEPSGAEQAPQAGSDLSEAARAGEDLFNANCSVCHGVGATGTNQGPTLIDRIYHPGHHPDFSIRNAVSQGVQQHHWGFGDMAPVAGLSSDDVEKIICYVRELQRADGIFEGDDFSTVC